MQLVHITPTPLDRASVGSISQQHKVFFSGRLSPMSSNRTVGWSHASSSTGFLQAPKSQHAEALSQHDAGSNLLLKREGACPVTASENLWLEGTGNL